LDHILFNSPAYGEEIAHLVGTELPPKSASIARVRMGTLLGGAVYYNKFGTTSISAHIAGKEEHWLTRDLLWCMFDYPFNQLGVQRIFGFVAEDNPRAVRFNLKLGFRFASVIDGMFKNDVACAVMRLDREDCRWLKLTPRSITRHYH
jgi:RimJ/RimL family protein N-acetyltransferase